MKRVALLLVACLALITTAAAQEPLDIAAIFISPTDEWQVGEQHIYHVSVFGDIDAVVSWHIPPGQVLLSVDTQYGECVQYSCTVHVTQNNPASLQFSVLVTNACVFRQTARFIARDGVVVDEDSVVVLPRGNCVHWVPLFGKSDWHG